MSNDAFVALPALPLLLALALLALALARGALVPGAAFNAVAGLALTVVAAMLLSQEGNAAVDARLLAEFGLFGVELVIALTSLLFFTRRNATLAFAVKIGLGVHLLLAAALQALAIALSTANFAWH